jgi:hypothetical protein
MPEKTIREASGFAAIVGPDEQLVVDEFFKLLGSRFCEHKAVTLTVPASVDSCDSEVVLYVHEFQKTALKSDAKGVWAAYPQQGC